MMISAFETAKERLPIGGLLKGGAYRVKEHKPTAIVLERLATGSTVRLTRKKIESTTARIQAGEEIAARTISYTVAEEYGIAKACNLTMDDKVWTTTN
jgi:hypothetical protein